MAGTLIDNHVKRTARLRRSMYVSCWRLGQLHNRLAAHRAAAVDAGDVLERIVISPYAAPWFVHEVRKSLSRIAPSLVSRIQPSSMGRGPYL